jgi:hypothetical protein
MMATCPKCGSTAVLLQTRNDFEEFPDLERPAEKIRVPVKVEEYRCQNMSCEHEFEEFIREPSAPSKPPTSSPTIPLGRYRHYKGNEYTVLGVAQHSETLEELVVYRQEYGEYGLWVRPRQMFFENVAVDDREVPRFRYLGE